jgi:hypothetical protein
MREPQGVRALAGGAEASADMAADAAPAVEPVTETA